MTLTFAFPANPLQIKPGQYQLHFLARLINRHEVVWQTMEFISDYAESSEIEPCGCNPDNAINVSAFDLAQERVAIAARMNVADDYATSLTTCGGYDDRAKRADEPPGGANLSFTKIKCQHFPHCKKTNDGKHLKNIFMIF